MSSIPLLITADSYCSGVLIDEQHIATAYHCVAASSKVHVEWEDGVKQRAEVLFVDVKSDLAILSVDTPKEERRFLELSVQDTMRGVSVYALGHPFAPAASGKYSDMLRWSITKGIVSQVGEKWLQTDTALNPGNSGGPLVDAKGEVLGIVSHKFRAEGLSFVSASKGLNALIQSQKKMSWFGGVWQMYPAVSIPTQAKSNVSLDVQSSFVVRDVMDFGVRGRLYGDVMDTVEEQGEVYHYPFSTHILGRVRLGYGQESVVFSGGLSALYEYERTYEEGYYGENSGYAWSWITRIHAGGFVLSVEGVPESSLILFGVGLDSLGFRGVF